jgi:hypothetical protein
MMQQPIHITIDPLCTLAYIEYRNFDEECDTTLRVLREPDGSAREYGRDDGRREEGAGVHVDLNEHDDIVGLEIIDIDDPELVSIARQYAADNDLAFPADIRAAAARSPAA